MEDLRLGLREEEDDDFQFKQQRSKTWILGAVGLIAVIIGAIAGATFAKTSDSKSTSNVTVYYNANIYTVDVYNPRAQAFAIQDAKFIAVGSNDYVLTQFPTANKVDVENRTVIPGITDSHAHLMGLGLSKLGAELYGVASIDDVIATLEAWMNAQNPKFDPKTQWVIGRGWDQNNWGTEFPTKKDLDGAFPDVPVWLRRVDGHAAWANSKAIAAAKLPTENPVGGEIIRDENGEPTGIFLDAAMDYIDSVQPQPTTAQLQQAALLAIAECNSVGITGVHDAGVSQDYLNVFKTLIDQNQFTIRNYAMYQSCGVTYCKGASKIIDYGLQNGIGPLLNVRSVKLYVDGALGSWGAALLEPYSDNPNTSGILYYDPPEQFFPLVDEWVTNGWQVNSHAIGDRANNLVINALVAAIQKDEARGGPGRQLRHRIEHTQIILPSDVVRMGNWQIIPSMQPTHATSDMRFVPDRLGPDRTEAEAYPWSAALNATGVIPLGSDFPVESSDPRLGFYAAITRQNTTGYPAGGWLPQYKLTRQQTLKGFTLDAAYASFQERELGSITAGKWADFLVLDYDIMEETGDPFKVLSTGILSTYLGGKKVYSK